MVVSTRFGITLPSSGSVPGAFWEVLNWGSVNRILWMGVLCLVTWCVQVTKYNTPIHNLLSTDPQLSISQKALGSGSPSVCCQSVGSVSPSVCCQSVGSGYRLCVVTRFLQLTPHRRLSTSLIRHLWRSIPTFGNAECRLFLFAAQCFNTESMQKVITVVTVVCKHFASCRGHPNYRWHLIRYAKG
jgi:hypothetical protein